MNFDDIHTLFMNEFIKNLNRSYEDLKRHTISYK